MKVDLEEWQICKPDNREDELPQPYRLIAEVLSETILYQLSLRLFEVQQKRKDKNYEGTLREYHSQNTLDPDNIATFSSSCNSHNHLLAGDKAGSIYLLDLAKKTVFHKKELFPGRRLTHIAEADITDGDLLFTTAAALLNSHHKIYILRYRHDQPKLQLTHQVKVAVSCDDPGKLPYYCHFQDYSRLLIVYTYNGSILAYRIPEMLIDVDAIQRGQSIPLQQEEVKKKLRYPLNYANIETDTACISEVYFQIKFAGKKKALSQQQLLAKITKKAEAVVAEPDLKKDPKKKEDKKEEKKEPQAEAQTQELLFNEAHPLREVTPQNGNDNSEAYPRPRFSPFLFVLHSRAELPKKKQFEKGKYVDICERIVYGWTNTRFFYVAALLPKKTNYCCNFIYLQHFQQKVPEQFAKEKAEVLSQKPAFGHSKAIKNIEEITATAVSQQDEYFAAGLANGVTSIWATNSLNIHMNTSKQKGEVTQLAFFQNWKLISGTSKGQVQIDNLLSLTTEVKRTNIFESKIDYPILSIKISQLGIAFALDSNANLRVYDLWRNQKIARLYSCNSFAAQENKAKRWVSASNAHPSLTLYTNNDFTVVLSNNWPSYTQREISDSEQKTAEINRLLQNPWKCSGTNVHVIRNFELLITLFEGLETIYKKGYDRKKVENLFSNLEFAQLYDRSFDIPDFSVTNAGKKTDKGSERGFGVRTKTHISSKSKQKLLKESSSMSSNMNSNSKADLTNVVLHPQKFLLQRRKIGASEVITSELLQAKVREGFKRQAALENMLLNDLSKGQV